MNKINCTVCNTELDAPLPDLQLVNHILFSQVIAIHPVGIECANCGAYYLPAIANAQCAWIWAQAEKPIDAARIITPNGLGRMH